MAKNNKFCVCGILFHEGKCPCGHTGEKCEWCVDEKGACPHWCNKLKVNGACLHEHNGERCKWCKSYKSHGKCPYGHNGEPENWNLNDIEFSAWHLPKRDFVIDSLTYSMKTANFNRRYSLQTRFRKEVIGQ